MKNVVIVDETITWNKVQNMMTTSSADAPYLGATKPKGTVAFDDFVTAVKDGGCSESELEIRRVTTKQGELLKAYVAQNYKVYFPVGIAGVHITKSFPTQDAPFNPSVNEAIMSIQTNAQTRNCLTGVTLKEDRAAAAALKGPKINSVCTGGASFDVIDGTEPFVIAGTGLHLDKAKATDKVTLANAKTGIVTDVTDYTCDGEGFRIDAQLGTALPAGKYVLAVYVDEGTAGNPNVLSAERKVKVIGSSVSPKHVEITKVMATTSDGNRCFWAEGTDFSAVEGYREFEEEEVRRFACTCEVSVNGESRGTFELTGTFPEEGDLLAPGIDDAFEYAHGDEVRAVFRIDPAKTDYDQTPVVRTTTAD